jgi:hypothetical protein
MDDRHVRRSGVSQPDGREEILSVRPHTSAALTAGLVVIHLAATAAMQAQPQAGRGAAPAPPTPRAAAPIDVTGYWVAYITEDWRWRMVTPAKGDYASIPLNVEGKRVADLWDPAKDEAAGEVCKSYGAPGLMRAPTRLHITWLDDSTLKLESDYGMQTRLLQFRPRAGAAAAPSLQGLTTAQWVMTAGRGRAGAPRRGSLKSVTTRLRPGYLRKNGVPYSANTVFTEYWDVLTGPPNNTEWLVVTNVVEDPANLQIPWITSVHFKKEPDGTKWDPTPCSAKF